MLTSQFSGLNLVSAYKARELCEAIASKGDGTHVVGVWCAMTGFAVRAVVSNGLVAQWFIRGPMELEDARAELLTELPDLSVRAH